MRGFYRILYLINITIAMLCAFSVFRELYREKWDNAWSASIASIIWILFALFCRRQINRIDKEVDIMLGALSKLDYDQAIQSATLKTLSIPRGLLEHKIKIQKTEWHAFEYKTVQFVIAMTDANSKPHILKID